MPLEKIDKGYYIHTQIKRQFSLTSKEQHTILILNNYIMKHITNFLSQQKEKYTGYYNTKQEELILEDLYKLK